ncbi:MAG: hypothetical protein ACFB21_10630 [Opitutales bacterium]
MSIFRSGLARVSLLTCAALATALALTPASAARPADSARGHMEVEPLEAAEAQQFLERVRTQRLQNDFVFRFSFVHLPNRGEDQRYHGELFGAWSTQGPVLRAVISPEIDRSRLAQAEPVEVLLHAGEEPRIWRKNRQGEIQPVTSEDWSKPLLQGLVYTAFDLGLPFIYWEDTTFQEARRFRGRSAYFFTARPPEDQTYEINGTPIASVEIAFDADFYALLRARFYDADGDLMRTLNINSFKKLDSGQYIVRSIDLVDERSRDKTRFSVTAANDQRNLQPALFDPGHFGDGTPLAGDIPMEQL